MQGNRPSPRKNAKLSAASAARLKLFCLFPVLLTVLLSACSWTPRDSAPTGDVDIDAISDAVPRLERLSSSGNPSRYEINGVAYYPSKHNRGFSETGIASWYGSKFHGKRTASGEPYDMYRMTAAHKTLPIPSYVKVTNLSNQRQVIVRVNDRGPFVDDRIIDLSYVAGLKLGLVSNGTAQVEVLAITPGQETPEMATASPNVSPEGSQLFLQLGAFAKMTNATRLVAKLSGVSRPPVRIESFERDGDTLYRVRIGPFQHRQAVTQYEKEIKTQGIHQPGIIIVQSP